jgi:hypothetical protein
VGIPIIGQGNNTPSAGQGQVTEIKDEGPKIRILYCWNCKSIEELPDFEGHPDDDVLLAVLIERHESAGVPHSGTIFKIGVKLWSQEKYRKEIIEQMRDQVGGGLDNLDKGYYETRSTFYEDAMSCYSKHLRPQDSCPDWQNENKRLIPKTAELRKEAGLIAPDKSQGTRVYLCDFCPVKSNVMTKQRRAAGMYKE